MGIETILFAAFTGLKAYSQFRAAEDQAKSVTRNAAGQVKALKDEGELAMDERRKKIRYTVARQTESFLSSGLTLEGTPQDVLMETFDTGIADVKNIGRNYQTSINNTITAAEGQAKSIMSNARTEVISTIAGGFSGGDIGSMFSGGGFTIPGTGSSSYVNASGIPIPGNKPARINF